jgi:tetratricopeptide (TPR) repeat protein
MLERAEVTFKRSGDYIGMLKSVLNKGVILHMMGRNEEAETVLMPAVEMSRRAGVRHLLVGALTNLSSIHLVKGRYELSRDLSGEALSIATGLRDERGTVAAKNNLALSYIRLGETKKGIRLLKESLQLSEKVGTHGLSADAMEGIYEGYMAMGRKAEAISYAHRALALAKRMGMARVVKRIERLTKKDWARRDPTGCQGRS